MSLFIGGKDTKANEQACDSWNVRRNQLSRSGETSLASPAYQRTRRRNSPERRVCDPLEPARIPFVESRTARRWECEPESAGSERAVSSLSADVRPNPCLAGSA